MIENKLIDKAKYEEELAQRWNWIAEDISDEDTRLNTMLVLENSYKKTLEKFASSEKSNGETENFFYLKAEKTKAEILSGLYRV